MAKKILVTGGTDKALDFSPLALAAKKAKAIILLAGTGSAKLAAMLEEAGVAYQGPFDKLDLAVQTAITAAQPGDIVVTTKNFGAGSSRQQAVDCFKALGVQCIIAESYGAIYERNAINAALPILTYTEGMLEELELKTGDTISVDFISGALSNLTNGKATSINKFYDAQLQIYKNGGLL